MRSHTQWLRSARHRNRRNGHSLSPRPIATCGGKANHLGRRLARFRSRFFSVYPDAEGPRSAWRRRHGGGRIPRSCAFANGRWFLGETNDYWLQRPAGSPCMGQAYGGASVVRASLLEVATGVRLERQRWAHRLQKGLAGIHLNTPMGRPPPEDRTHTGPEGEAAIAAGKRYMDWDSSYSKIQSTHPQTIGYGLVDSLVGLTS